LTGANGFIATHCVSQLLLIGPPSNQDRPLKFQASSLLKSRSSHPNFSFQVVSDFSTPDHFGTAVSNRDAVLHLEARGDGYACELLESELFVRLVNVEVPGTAPADYQQNDTSTKYLSD
jgi:hypothetical protein